MKRTYSEISQDLNEQFLSAVKRQDHAKIDELRADPKRYPFDINCHDKKGNSALHLAILKDDVKLIEKLIEMKCDVNIRDFNGDTPLIMASGLGGNKKAVKELLKCRDIDINAKDKVGWTALTWATNNHRLDSVTCIANKMEENKINIDELTSDGYSALYLACEKNNIKIVEYLLEKGANPDLIVHDSTPFFITCDGSHGKLVTSLLKHKELGSRQKDETDIVIKRALDGIDYFLRINQDPSKTLQAKKASIKMAGYIILELSKIQTDTFKILAQSIEHYPPECTSFITEQLKISDNVKNEKNADGQTLLFLACQNGKQEIIQALTSRENIQIADSQGWTPLTIAISKGKFECVAELLKIDQLDLNTLDKDGLSPLHIAIQNIANSNDNKKIVDLLLNSQKTNPNICCADNEHPISYAITSQNRYAIKKLLDHSKSAFTENDIKDAIRNIALVKQGNSSLNPNADNSWLTDLQNRLENYIKPSSSPSNTEIQVGTSERGRG